MCCYWLYFFRFFFYFVILLFLFPTVEVQLASIMTSNILMSNIFSATVLGRHKHESKTYRAVRRSSVGTWSSEHVSNKRNCIRMNVTKTAEASFNSTSTRIVLSLKTYIQRRLTTMDRTHVAAWTRATQTIHRRKTNQTEMTDAKYLPKFCHKRFLKTANWW